MAENVTLNTMTGGSTIGADEITSVHYQRVKIIEGADGTNDGDISSANPLPVELVAGAVKAGSVVSGAILSGALASGSISSGALASGSIASGAIASGAIASGAIVAGAIVAGDTSIATTEDTARAAGEHLVKVGASRLDTPVANANCADNDYTNLTVDNFGKLWVAGAAIEDTAETAGMSVMVGGAVRRDALASSSTTDGDISTLNTNATGALWVCPSGNVAHDATDSGNPIKMGAKVESTPSAQVCADTDRTDLIADMDGALLVRTECTIGDLLTESISNTNGTATASAVFTTGAGIRNVICNIIAYNSSATGGFCILTDGSGGTTLMTVPLPAGGGCVIPLGGVPIKTTANTALYFDVSGALSTVYLTFTGYRTKVT